jgi:hypothetical protein
MSQFNSTSTLDGLFKKIYGQDILKLVPDAALLTKLIPFKDSEKLGKNYSVPVVLSNEQGITVLASGDGVQTLNDSVALTSKEATVSDCQLYLRAALDYETLNKASQKGDKAFRGAMDVVVENMMESATKRLEVMMLYGQSGLGKFSSTGATTTRTFTFTAATWAPGIWAGMENAALDVYNGSTKINTNAQILVTGVDFDSKAITVSGNATDLTACDASANAYDVYFKGQYGKEMAGLDKIITNTGSLFGIDASAYSLWKGNSHSAGSAALTMAKVLSAASKAVAKGGLKGDAIVMVSPVTWQNLNSDQASLRKYDDSYSESKFENGVEAIVFHGVSGRLEVIANPICKEGEAFIFPKKKVKRIGSNDISFELPGKPGQIFMHVPDKNAAEIRLTAGQALFVEAPAQCVKITAIVNS